MSLPTTAEQVRAADDDAAKLKVVQVVDQKRQNQSWYGYFWDTFDLSKEERRLLFKVDASLLLFASVSVLLFPSDGASRVLVIHSPLSSIAWLLHQKS